MGRLRTTIKLRRFDSNFVLINEHEQVSKSWLKHFFDLLYEPLYYQNNTLANIADIGGNLRTLIQLPANGRGFLCNLLVSSPGGRANRIITGTNGGGTAGVANVNEIDGQNIGIVVGSNNTAVTPTDNALNTKIAHGEAATQLLYGGCETYGLAFADPNGEFKIRRYFTNVSGGDVTVREVGIYSPGLVANDTAYAFAIARDVTADTVIATTEILEVEYTVQITV